MTDALKKPQLGNVVIKEFLASKGIDLTKLRTHVKNGKERIRARKNRMPGSEISVPVPRTNAALKEELKVITHHIISIKTF